MKIQNNTNKKIVEVPKKDFESWKPEMRNKFTVLSNVDTAPADQVVVSKTTPESGTKKK